MGPGRHTIVICVLLPLLHCSPQAPRPNHPPPPFESLEGDITQQEVEQALPKLSDGKSAAQAGWPADYIATEDGHKLFIWILALLLARLLDACFTSGRLPACISSALVTPFQKGFALDSANYRPIAVGQPLYRLYTIIMNDWLVTWSEQHHLRTPCKPASVPSNQPSITSLPSGISLTMP